MSLSVKANVSSVVKYQVPEYIRNNTPNFVEFLSHYYKFLEQSDNPLDFLRNSGNKFDVDNTTSQFLEKLKAAVFPFNVKNVDQIITDEMLIKFVRELYLRKGNEDSFKFLFEKILGNDITMEYGRDFVFRTSDNDYVNDIILILSDPMYRNLFALDGKLIHQGNEAYKIEEISLFTQSGWNTTFTFEAVAGTNVLINVSSTTGIHLNDVIFDSELYIPPDTQVVAINGNVLTISNVVQKSTQYAKTAHSRTAYYSCKINSLQSTNENISIDYNTPVSFSISTETWYLDVSPIIVDVEVGKSGALYQPGQNIRAFGGSGIDATLMVNEVAPGSVDDIMLLSPGTGYVVGDVITFPSQETNDAATAVVEAIDGYGAIIQPVMEFDLATIHNTGYEYAVNDIITLNTLDMNGVAPKLKVSSVTTNTLNKVKITNSGSGYKYGRALFKVNTTYYTTNATIKYGNITNVPIPGTTITTTPTIYMNGSGCTGTITVSGGVITLITVSTQGINYVDPVLSVSLSGVTMPSFTFTFGTNHSITAIAASSSYTLPNGTHSFTVNERYGSGFTATPLMSGNVTGVTIDTNGEFASVEPYLTSLASVGYGATFDVTYKLKRIDVTNGGVNYFYPTLSVSGANTTPFSANLVTTGGVITGTTINSYGSGYTETPTVTINDGLIPNYSVFDCVLTQNGTTITTVSNGFANTKIGHKLFFTLLNYNATVTGVTDANTITVDTPAPDNQVGAELYFVVPTGKLSSLKLTHKGSGYTTLPNVDHGYRAENFDVTISNDTTLAKIIPLSTSIGKIKSIKIFDHGIGYNDQPIIAAPLVAITTDNQYGYIVGEMIHDANYTYTDTVNYSDGPNGVVLSYDPTKNLLVLDRCTDEFLIISEQDDILMYETNDPINHEYSFAFSPNSVLVGRRSGVSSTILYYDRANIYANVGSTTNPVSYLKNSAGFTSYDNIRLHDGKQIQDYSYIVTTYDTVVNNIKRLLHLADYQNIVKDTVHPAGYRMYGKTRMINELLVPFSLGSLIDASGYDTSNQLLLTFILDAINVFNSPGFDNQDFLILIETHLDAIMNQDFDTTSGLAFKYRVVEILNEAIVDISMTANNQDTLIHIDHDATPDCGISNFSPSDLESFKFKMIPYEGMEFTPQYSWGTGITMISQFDDLTIDSLSDQILSNVWDDPNRRNYIKDTYTIIIKDQYTVPFYNDYGYMI